MNTNDTVAVDDALLQCFKVLGQPLMIYSNDEGTLSSRKVHDFFKAEGITHVVTKTRANQAERAIRTVKKMIADRLRARRNKTWVEMMEASVNRYQVHSTIRLPPDTAHKTDNAVQVRANTI